MKGFGVSAGTIGQLAATPGKSSQDTAAALVVTGKPFAIMCGQSAIESQPLHVASR
jgi:hypothetical protein